LLDAGSAPGFFILPALGLVLLSLFLESVWLIRALSFVLIHRRAKQSQQTFKKTWRRWMVCPAIVFLTMVLLSLNVPLRLRFAVSRAALNQTAQQAITAGPNSISNSWWNDPVQRLGAYSAAVVKIKPTGEVDFYVPGTEFMRSFSGFAYSPNAAPDDPERSFEPLGGGWYNWHTSW
jgi:hypothetical protein